MLSLQQPRHIPTLPKARQSSKSTPLQLFPSKQTFANAIGMSVEGLGRVKTKARAMNRLMRRCQNPVSVRNVVFPGLLDDQVHVRVL